MALASTAQLRDRLHRQARQEIRFSLLTGILRVLLTLVLFCVVFFFVDWLFHLGVVSRALLVVIGAAGVLWNAWSYLVEPLRIPHNEEAVALRLERQFPELRDRLISVVQLTREEAATGGIVISADLLRRLEEDTANIAHPLDFSKIIDWSYVRRLLLISGIAFIAASASSVSFPDYARAMVMRMALKDEKYPTLTRIEQGEFRTKIVRGDDWQTEVTLSGKIPGKVMLRILPPDQAVEPEEFEMRPVLGYTYGLTLKKVQGTFMFQVVAGDAETEPAEVVVIHPIEVLEPAMSVTPPAYSGLPRVTGVGVYATEVLEGSSVELQIPLTKPMITGQLVPKLGDPIPLTPVGAGDVASVYLDIRTWKGEEAVEAHATDGYSLLYARHRMAQFEIHVTDLDGLENEEPRIMYRIRTRVDHAPDVRLLYPTNEKISVRYAKWPVQYRLADDFGLHGMWLAWEVDRLAPLGEGAGTARIGSKAIPAGTDHRNAEGEATLEMLPIGVSPGDTLNVWLEAADVRAGDYTPDKGGDIVGLTRSDPTRFVVVTEREKWLEMHRRLGVVTDQIKEVYEGQEELKANVETVPPLPAPETP